jgi:hypothetical protein
MVTRRVRGVSLIEALLAVIIVTMGGIAVLDLTAGGRRGVERAGEEHLASILLDREMDRLRPTPFAVLASLVGPVRPIDLPCGGRIDGVAFRAGFGIDALAPTMVKLTVTIGWQATSTARGPRERSLRAVRYVAAPAIAASNYHHPEVANVP